MARNLKLGLTVLGLSALALVANGVLVGNRIEFRVTKGEQAKTITNHAMRRCTYLSLSGISEHEAGNAEDTDCALIGFHWLPAGR